MQRPQTMHETIKIPKNDGLKVVEKPIRAWRRENIQLETVLGKLLSSYAMMKPKEFDIACKIS
jgi:hypothetical protein